MSHTVQIDINGLPFSIETGKVAKQADGAVVVRFGGTMVLATVVAAKSATEGHDFFPLTVEYREKAYAGGRIPGGFFKREGRAGQEGDADLPAHRPADPAALPQGFRNEMQVISLVISADHENDPDVLAMIGASAALCLSGIPFAGPVGAVRVGLVDGKLVANPTTAQQAASTLELVMAGTEDAVLMVEAGAKEVSEDRCWRRSPSATSSASSWRASRRSSSRRRPSRAGLRLPGRRRSGARGARCSELAAPSWWRRSPSTRSRRAPRPSARASRRCARPSASTTAETGRRCARPSRRSRRPRSAG